MKPELRVIAAAMLSPINRDESVAQLTARLPFNAEQIKEARRQLQLGGIVRLGKRRPPYGTRTVIAVSEAFDNRAGSFVYLPGAIVDKISAESPRGAAAPILLAMLYARCQLRRGAVHVRDTAAVNDLGLNMRRIKRAKATLRAAGIIEQVGIEGGTPVYVMPDLDQPADPSRLDPSRTLTETSIREKRLPKAEWVKTPAAARLREQLDHERATGEPEFIAFLEDLERHPTETDRDVSTPTKGTSRPPLKGRLDPPPIKKTEDHSDSLRESGGCAADFGEGDTHGEATDLDRLREHWKTGKLTDEAFAAQARDLIPF